MTRGKVMSILWFPAFLAVLVPVTIQVVFHRSPPHKLPVRSASGDGGPGIFFLVFPLMMAGAITTIVLLRRPTWGIGRRAAVVVGVGAVTAVSAWLAAVGLHVLPDKPLLLAYAFVLTQLASAPSIAGADGAPRASQQLAGDVLLEHGIEVAQHAELAKDH
jgi:hypothetical protein